MHSELSGWLWLVIDVVFVGALGAILIYGTTAWRKRDKSPQATAARDAATRQLYQDEDRRR
jgi:cytoskeletal protein RodZ